MKLKVTLIITACLLFLSHQIIGQGFLRAEGKKIVNENGEEVLLRGMGLGGWMLQEGYMLQTAGFANAQHQIRERIEELIGAEATDEFYEAWLANHVRKADIDSLKAWGFNSVRLPMHYNLFTLPIEEEPIPGEHTWLDKGFILTDSLLSWCKQNEMYLILDLHAAPGGQGRDEGISDYDTDKPSLWESTANRNKTAALWQRIAEHYADEPWIGGYDLINETNWPLENNNALLRELYELITQVIRSVDKNHILFIEGNWFANDFTGLTPPWDDNFVYSPHKYWSINDQASIQWVLDLREQYNVPLYFGESGENSNLWFRDAIRLFEDNNIGWAWWPMKKIESIAGPLSVEKSSGYQDLLDYWNNGGTKPNAEVAKATLMALTEDLKIENCIYQYDVIDAMFRQVYSDETRPFTELKIPGLLYASDFDMGRADFAYHDTETGNYQVSTGNYTSWNNGWVYRNDGVDLERSEETVNTNGINVGWMSLGEWMQYTVDVEKSAIYDINVRVAANDPGGSFHFSSGGATITGNVAVPVSGGWQNWTTVTVRDVVLDTSDTQIRFHVDGEGYNLSSFEFIEKGLSTSIASRYKGAKTLDDQSVQLDLNKPMSSSLGQNLNDYRIHVNGNLINISSLNYDPNYPRRLILKVNYTFRSEDQIRISYVGNQVAAKDGTLLQAFSQQIVQNTVAIIHALPGRVQAEDYFFQSGIQLENTTDVGGGQNIGFLDNGDYLDYEIDVAQDGIYSVEYRTAALSERGAVSLSLIRADDSETKLHDMSFSPTGAWQNWQTSRAPDVALTAGRQTLRLRITQPLFNVNWFEFSFITHTNEATLFEKIEVFPNPVENQFVVEAQLAESKDLHLQLFDPMGRIVWQQKKSGSLYLKEVINLKNRSSGLYLLRIRDEQGRQFEEKILKLKH